MDNTTRSVFYKFKNSVSYETLKFKGQFISLEQLKRNIISRHNLDQDDRRAVTSVIITDAETQQREPSLLLLHACPERTTSLFLALDVPQRSSQASPSTRAHRFWSGWMRARRPPAQGLRLRAAPPLVHTRSGTPCCSHASSGHSKRSSSPPKGGRPLLGTKSRRPPARPTS